jgi:hypothetical protein
MHARIPTVRNALVIHGIFYLIRRVVNQNDLTSHSKRKKLKTILHDAITPRNNAITPRTC